MTQGILSRTRKPSTNAVSGSLRRHQIQRKHPSDVDQVPRCEGHRLQQVLATGPDDPSASLQVDTVAYASFSARKEMRVAEGLIVVNLPR